jgi:hypothetical protein
MSKQDWLGFATNLGTALLPVAGTLVSIICAKLIQLVHLQVSQTKLDQYQQLLYSAIAFVEETAAKRKQAGTAMTSASKLSLAVSFITQRLGDKPQNVESDIESSLAKHWMGATAPASVATAPVSSN